jgi:hypothetical protein
MAAEEEMASGRPPFLDQLQLDFDGIGLLSDEERVVRWLAEQPEESSAAYLAALFVQDAKSRRRRAEGWSQLRQMQEPFDTDWGWLIPGGVEAVWLYHEAERAYVHDLHLAALLCAHASCERVLASCLGSYEDRLDKNWTRWGLGPLTRAAREFGLIDDETRDQLILLTERRRVSAHYKPPLTPDSVMMRVVAQHPDGLADEDYIDEVLRRDAFYALTSATHLLRGNQGFARVRLYR